MFVFGFGIRTSLTVLVAIVAVRKYGIIAMMTGKRMKHAAMGRAKRSSMWGYTCAHHGAGVTDVLPSSDLVRQLQAARTKRVALMLEA